MQTVYCISGLGADEKVFKFPDLSFAHPVFIQWITPLKNETLHDYALRLKHQYIVEENPVIIGLSLGGMIAVEIVKTMPAARAIIISSAKTKNELPFYMRMLRFIPLYKILPDRSIKSSLRIQQYFLGAQSKTSRKYIRFALKNADTNFYKWAIGAIMKWDNQTIPSNIIHIHGTNDKLLPYKFVKPDISIKDGGHLMIIENAVEITALLKKLI
jgi:pimeloyl-ACP methyl ester carboxylesterase